MPGPWWAALSGVLGYVIAAIVWVYSLLQKANKLKDPTIKLINAFKKAKKVETAAAKAGKTTRFGRIGRKIRWLYDHWTLANMQMLYKRFGQGLVLTGWTMKVMVKGARFVMELAGILWTVDTIGSGLWHLVKGDPELTIFQIVWGFATAKRAKDDKDALKTQAATTYVDAEAQKAVLKSIATAEEIKNTTIKALQQTVTDADTARFKAHIKAIGDKTMELGASDVETDAVILKLINTILDWMQGSGRIQASERGKYVEVAKSFVHAGISIEGLVHNMLQDPDAKDIADMIAAILKDAAETPDTGK